MAAVGQGVRDAIERLAPRMPASLSSLTDDQVVGLAQEAEALLRLAEALTLAVAREVDQRSDETLGEESLARKLGAKRSAGALETITRTTADDARRRVAESRNLGKLPVVERAVAEGALARAQAEAIGKPILATLHIADPVAVDAACTELVELARALPASAVAEAAQLWQAALDPDGIEPDEKKAVEKRFFRLGRAQNGLVKLTGLLPLEQAAAIRAVLDAHRNPRAGSSVTFSPADDSGESGANAAEFPPPVDPRSPEQKNADILYAVFTEHARSGNAPTMGGAHPTILVTVTTETLETGRGAAWIDGEAEPISADSAARIADAGGYQEVALSRSGEVLNLSHTMRCFSPAQRRALAARDKGCVIPGCTAPARWCEAHHIIAWQNGGPTDIGNAALLCWWHHFIIDDGPYRLRMVDGVPQVRWVFGTHASEWVNAVHRPERLNA